MAWYDKSKPDEIKPFPWLSLNAIKYFESILRPDMTVMEHGSGGSTLWLAERVREVFSIEADPDWYRAIDRMRPSNVFLFTTMVMNNENDKYNLVLIDGEPVQDRGVFLILAPRLVSHGGWVVLDNANRPEYAQDREGLKNYADLIYTSPLEGKHLVTEFWRMR